MKKSGLADSPFFLAPQPKNETPAPPLVEAPSVPAQAPKIQKPKTVKAKAPEEGNVKTPPQDTTNASMQASMHASNNASMQSLIHESIIEVIRKAVKDVGKDSATFRFTPEEKKALLELSFSYKMQGYKTSENELTRIAINFLLEDQKQNGRNSVLQRVLDALNK